MLSKHRHHSHPPAWGHPKPASAADCLSQAVRSGQIIGTNPARPRGHRQAVPTVAPATAFPATVARPRWNRLAGVVVVGRWSKGQAMGGRDEGAAGSDARFDLGRARVTALVNLGAGRRSGRQIAALLHERLAPACGSFDLRLVRRRVNPGDLAREAIAAGAEVVVAAGGDGTQAAVAQALAGTETVMAVLPGGTFNYFARDIGMPETPQAAVAVLIGARPRRIDLADVNGTVFLNNASFGLYPDILESREALYKRWGRSRLGAYWTVLSSLWNLRRPMELTAELAGETRHFHTPLAFMAASPLQLDSLGLEGAEALRQGRLALFVARGQTPRALVGAALRLAMGRAVREDDFDLIEIDDVTISTRPNERKIAHDGERSRMEGPFRLHIRRGALRVLAPLTRPDGSPARGSA